MTEWMGEMMMMMVMITITVLPAKIARCVDIGRVVGRALLGKG